MPTGRLESDGETLSVLELGEGERTIVFLHGAGGSDKHRLGPVRERLAARFRVVSVDFSGHGDATGRLAELSLERRARQAIDICAGREVAALVGTSMSGQTVCDVLGAVRPGAVVLLNPAAYAPEAWRIPFGPGFTSIIRQPRSWERSAAYARLAAFAGPRLLITSEFDEVIPAGVTALFAAASDRHEVLAGASHQLTAWLRRHPDQAETVAGWIARAADEPIGPPGTTDYL